MKDNVGRVFFGLLVIAVGLVFLLGNMDKLDVGDVFSTYWPMFLIFFGLAHLISNNFRNSGPGLILLAIGGFFQLSNWGILGDNIWMIFWPLLIIAGGIWIIFNSGIRKGFTKVPDMKGDDLGASVIMSGIKRRVESKQFRGGKASVVMGSFELDLRDAGLEGNKATIDLSAVMGEIKVFVPRNWNVEVGSSNILGEVNNSHSPSFEGEPVSTLYIKASSVMASVGIHN
ncbi:LiaI-LiaF-like domain-containing protein [Acidobacteriota bacterium]